MLKIWAPDDQKLPDDSPGWVFEEEELDASASGTAYAVSVTRDTAAAVKQYLQENGLKARRLLVARPSGGVSAQAVSSGAHANALAEDLAVKLKQDRNSNPAARRERIHLFISAPNAFTFYLGRQVAMMKPLTLYEYDFTYQIDSSYRPSLSYPEVMPAAAVIN